MKGNARIIVFIGVVLFILLIVLLNMTLFTIKNVTVLNEVESQLIDEEKIISDSDIKSGSNIFVISEKKISDKIEYENPYIQVVNIERVFPNKVIIHVGVRYPLMAIKVKDSNHYVVVDSSLKILQRIDESETLYKTCTKVEGLEVTNPEKGHFLDITNTYNARLCAIAFVAENEKINNIAFLHFFESIKFTGQDDIVQIKLRSGVTICLKGSEEAENKFRYGLTYYRLLGEQSYKRNSGYIFYKSAGNDSGWTWEEEYPY